MVYAFLSAHPAFDPFGAGPMPKPQELMGSFRGPAGNLGNLGLPAPLLHAARSPSPTMQNTHKGDGMTTRICRGTIYPHISLSTIHFFTLVLCCFSQTFVLGNGLHVHAHNV